MNWKHEFKLSDLEPRAQIEVTCRRCGKTRYETPEQITAIEPDLAARYLDEVEFILFCHDRFCRGGVRVALVHDDKNEGFVGGMA